MRYEKESISFLNKTITQFQPVQIGPTQPILARVLETGENISVDWTEEVNSVSSFHTNYQL